MQGLQGMNSSLKGLNGFPACANPECRRPTPFPVDGMCARCSGMSIEGLARTLAMRGRHQPPRLYACAACPARMVYAYWTQRPGVVLCGNCADRHPDDPPQTQAVIYHGPVREVA